MFKLSETLIIQPMKSFDSSYLKTVKNDILKGREDGVIIIPKDFKIININERTPNGTND